MPLNTLPSVIANLSTMDCTLFSREGPTSHLWRFRSIDPSPPRFIGECILAHRTIGAAHTETSEGVSHPASISSQLSTTSNWNLNELHRRSDEKRQNQCIQNRRL